MTKTEIKTLLEFATKNALFLFNGKYYEQIDSVSMASPVGPYICQCVPLPFGRNFLKKVFQQM